MRSVDILEMIKKGRIEELKEKLREEIYEDALKNKSGAKKRYTTMKSAGYLELCGSKDGRELYTLVEKKES